MFKSTDDKIDAYCDAFNRLKEEFYGRVAAGIKMDASENRAIAEKTKAFVEETKIVVTHILDDMENIGVWRTSLAISD